MMLSLLVFLAALFVFLLGASVVAGGVSAIRKTYRNLSDLVLTFMYAAVIVFGLLMSSAAFAFAVSWVWGVPQ